VALPVNRGSRYVGGPAGPRRAWDALGLALRDYWRGHLRASVQVHRADGVSYPMPARLFFRGRSALSSLERMALRLCRGRILDVGAGAGCHSLLLQARGFEVTALDVSPHAVSVMRRRGLRRVARGEAMAPPPGPFDTVLLLMNGIAVVGTLAGLRRFLRRVGASLPADGQVLFDSLDLRRDPLSRPGALARARHAGRYFGELCFRLEYRGRMGPPFRLLFVDPARLVREARDAGWRCEVILRAAQGRYLARLTPPPQRARKPRQERSNA